MHYAFRIGSKNRFFFEYKTFDRIQVNLNLDPSSATTQASVTNASHPVARDQVNQHIVQPSIVDVSTHEQVSGCHSHDNLRTVAGGKHGNVFLRMPHFQTYPHHLFMHQRSYYR